MTTKETTSETDTTKGKKEKISVGVLLKTIHRSLALCFTLTPKLTIQMMLLILSLEFFPLLQNGLFGKIINSITEVVSGDKGVGAPMSYVIQFILLYVAVLVISS
ncbi:MAG: hypothetical protein KBC62_04790, partial [Candidatus Pacebacteria bacterium]|nr:hypothetical protein [Candidatus Paceibacterota bacterium]